MDHSKIDVSNIIELARLGDVEAIHTLLSQVQPQLYRFSMRMCRHTYDAEDVVQESMITLARSIHTFQGESSLSTWLFSIVRNICIKNRRRSKFAPEHVESLDYLKIDKSVDFKSMDPSPYDSVESTQMWQQIETGLSQLEPQYREVILLRDIEGLSAKEVAWVVGISSSAVKSRLHRARVQLRDYLSTAPYHPKSGCPDIRQAFSYNIEGALTPETCLKMEEHITECESCADECTLLKNIIHLCGKAPYESLGNDFESQLKKTLHTHLES